MGARWFPPYLTPAGITGRHVQEGIRVQRCCLVTVCGSCPVVVQCLCDTCCKQSIVTSGVSNACHKAAPCSALRALMLVLHVGN